MSLAGQAVPRNLGGASALDRVERIVQVLIEVPAVVGVLVEVVILFVGIVARVLHRPIIWSDELASIVFMWLAMFGAAVALRRGDHMRLTTVASLLPPRARAVAEAFSIGCVALFLVFVLRPLLLNGSIESAPQ